MKTLSLAVILVMTCTVNTLGSPRVQYRNNDVLILVQERELTPLIHNAVQKQFRGRRLGNAALSISISNVQSNFADRRVNVVLQYRVTTGACAKSKNSRSKRRPIGKDDICSGQLEVRIRVDTRNGSVQADARNGDVRATGHPRVKRKARSIFDRHLKKPLLQAVDSAFGSLSRTRNLDLKQFAMKTAAPTIASKSRESKHNIIRQMKDRLADRDISARVTRKGLLVEFEFKPQEKR